MIKIEKGEVELKGTVTVLSAEMVMGVRAMYKELSTLYGEAGAEEAIRKSLETAFMSKEEIEKKAIDAFVKIAKKVNRPQEDE